MEQIMVKIENLTKRYRLGVLGGTTLRDELQRRRAKRKHLEDPTVKIGNELKGKAGDTFLALDNISFEVHKGEAVGIIGHNGAGKSTLLKLITRITAPTEGSIKLNGRVASMLEVGTGFHPELTGRENIYVNGAILGMTKKEIDAKIEDIIEFSECRKFIDTPVKRYSSGMYVKLAFSVSAHLDSEIMIMDEVLAVGDVAFQNKCINKMKEVADAGRTVLYVSHNMNTIRKLCKKCIVMDHGKVVFIGETEKAISVYMNNSVAVQSSLIDLKNANRYGTPTGVIKMVEAEFLSKENTSFSFGEKLKFRLKWESEKDIKNLLLRLHIKRLDTSAIGVLYAKAVDCKKGLNENIYDIDLSSLVPGQYTVTAILFERNEIGVEHRHECVEPAFNMEITADKNNTLFFTWEPGWGDVIFNTGEN